MKYPPPQLAVNQRFMYGNIVFRKGKTKCCIKMAKKRLRFRHFSGRETADAESVEKQTLLCLENQ